MGAISIPGVGESFLGDNPQVVKVKRVTAKFGGGDVALAAQGVYALVNVAANTFVLDVFSNVDIAFTASVTLDIGDGTDADGWLATAKVAPQAAVTSGLVKRTSKATAEAFAGGKLYTTADTIDVTVGGADVAAGELEVIVMYIENFLSID